MARVFTITAADNSVSLKKDGSGEITFTVSNVTARPIRGRVKLVALESAKPEWLSIAGESERDFSPGATHQVTVKIAVPSNTPPAMCSFRVDAENIANKDEEYDEGPSVAFKVEEQKKEAKAFPLWIIPVIVGVLVIIGVVVYLIIPKSVEVPSVTGVPVTEARDRLADAGLVATESEEAAKDVEAGQVIRQDPEPGAKIARGSEVALFVAAAPPGKVQVPNVVSLPLDRAKQEVEAKGLHVADGGEKATLDFEPGKVSDQDPDAFEPVDPGSTVTLFVAGKSVRVPDVKGLKLNPAYQQMNIRKLFVVNVTGTKLEETVVSTTPAANTVVLETSNVTIHMPGNFGILIPASKWKALVMKQ